MIRKKLVKQKKAEKKYIDSSSFRDPSGFVFRCEGIVYRQINNFYKENYQLLIQSGLYKKLVQERLLIEHREVDGKNAYNDRFYKVIRPKQVGFISYPYEWSFSMLKDAALTTLKIQKLAMEHKMILKDASSYNIQFVDGLPTLIDSLSFEKYVDGEPWVAYRQFCQHFFAPLALMSFTDIRLSQLLRIYIDGIPLDLASNLLPKNTYLNFSVLTHIHLHAKSQKKWADKQTNAKKGRVRIPKIQLEALLDSLISTVEKLKLKKTDTEWGEYYTFTNYNREAFKIKREIVAEMVSKIKPKEIWDLGANDGYFSRAADFGKTRIVSSDIDPVAVEKNYLQVKKNNEKNILPLLLDLTNPSSDYGWANKSRVAFNKRGPTDLVMALALIHHLAIGNNVPFSKLSEFFHEIGKYLLIEFVPKEDSQVKKLLSSREDIFSRYNEENFIDVFQKRFRQIDRQKVKGSLRTIYLFKAK